MKRPEHIVPSVRNIQTMGTHGPWATKSGGELGVLFGMSFAMVQTQYFDYRDEELAQVPGDIRGLRAYTVSNLPAGSVGGREWHRVRNEIVFALHGSVRWACEDLYGGKLVIVLDAGTGVWVPPFILHTYETISAGSELLVIANTLFAPEDTRTHDTYPLEEFRELQAEYSPR